eukprot:c41570_g1_i1.p1 GENE.c41570_g1_i1~~c41570_g1_i1.p1  ORF type:complete len:166 (+),score=27.19 c41570_g1_i1:46-543(+)
MDKKQLFRVLYESLSEACARATIRGNGCTSLGSLPTLDSLAPPRISLPDYIYWALSFVSTSTEHYVAVLILLGRLEFRHKTKVTDTNVIYLFVGLLVIVLKAQVHDFDMEHFCHKCGFPVAAIKVFENEVRNALNFDIEITQDLLQRCCLLLPITNPRTTIWCDL